MVKILIFLSLFFLLFSPFTYAQEVATPDAQISYTLPYPGLLPDNPLYILKVIRDRIEGFFITDRKQMAAFNLLQADKRLAAGMYLLSGGTKKETLAIETISKGENYFFTSIADITVAKRQGENVSDLLHQMLLSSQKHREILIRLSQEGDSTLRTSLLTQAQRVTDFIKEVKGLTEN